MFASLKVHSWEVCVQGACDAQCLGLHWLGDIPRQPMQSPLSSREYCLRVPPGMLLKIIKCVPSVFYHPCPETWQKADTQFNSKGKIICSVVSITKWGFIRGWGEDLFLKSPSKQMTRTLSGRISQQPPYPCLASYIHCFIFIKRF